MKIPNTRTDPEGLRPQELEAWEDVKLVLFGVVGGGLVLFLAWLLGC